MKLVKITENCYFSTPDDKTDRPCLGYIKTNGNIFMIDAGASENHTRSFLKLLRDNNLKKPTACIITHSHWDHTFGLSALTMPTYASAKAINKMEFENKYILQLADTIIKNNSTTRSIIYQSLSNEYKFIIDHLRVEYDDDFSEIDLVLPKNPIREIKTFGEPDAVISAFEFPTSMHSKDALLILDQRDKVLFAGDALYDNFNLDKKHNALWLEDRLPKVQKMRYVIEKIDFDYCVVSHYGVLTREETFDLIDDTFFTI